MNVLDSLISFSPIPYYSCFGPPTAMFYSCGNNVENASRRYNMSAYFRG